MLNLKFDPFPKLVTDRLVLRATLDSDADDLFPLRSDPEVMRYIPRPLAVSVDDVTALIGRVRDGIAKHESISWVITLKGSRKAIGMTGFVRMTPDNFRAELGYLLSPELSGKGIMHEANHAVIQYGFDVMKLHSIEGVIDPDNISSQKVLERLGFILEGHFRESEFWNGRFTDKKVYSLLSRNYIAPVKL